MTRDFLGVVLVGVMAAQGAPAQAIPADERGQKIVKDAIAALGGQNFLDMEDRVESGRAYSFYHEKLSGLSIAKIYTRYITVNPLRSTRELGLRERQAFGKNEDTAVVFREEGAANINWRGAKEMPAEDFARYRETMLHNIFYILRVRLHEAGLIFEFIGSDVVDRVPVDIVDVIDAENNKVRVYFHQITKLPVREVFYRRNAVTKDKDEEITVFSKYREVDGIQWPWAIERQRNGEKVFEIFADSVKFNDPKMQSNLFELPSDIKLLKPE